METESIGLFRQVSQPSPLVSAMLTRTSPPVVLSEKREDRQTIDIYRSVLRRLCGSQRVSSGKFIKPLMFILYSEVDTSADPDVRRAGSPVLSEEIRRGITRGSSDLPLRIVWVEDFYGVGRDPEGEYVPSGGAVVRFTGLRHDKADIALIDGSIHRWGVSPLGFEYVVEKKSGFWLVRSSYHKWIC